MEVWVHEARLSEVADSTNVRKWMWLFMNGCECNTQLHDPTEFLKSCQGGTYASVRLGNVVKNCDT